MITENDYYYDLAGDIKRLLSESSPKRFTASMIAKLLCEDIGNVRDALLTLVSSGDIIGHEQHGRILYYAKGAT